MAESGGVQITWWRHVAAYGAVLDSSVCDIYMYSAIDVKCILAYGIYTRQYRCCTVPPPGDRTYYFQSPADRPPTHHPPTHTNLVEKKRAESTASSFFDYCLTAAGHTVSVFSVILSLSFCRPFVPVCGLVSPPRDGHSLQEIGIIPGNILIARRQKINII